jgi:hypothetical protein
MAFLQGCGAATFAERIEWLALLERTSSSPRRRMHAALVREDLKNKHRLVDPLGLDLSPRDGESPEDRPLPDRCPWHREGAVMVDHWRLRSELQALQRYYGAVFIPLLARHTGISSRHLRRYLLGDIEHLTADYRNRLAAARVRIGSTPPRPDALHALLPPQVTLQYKGLRDRDGR